jgi:serine/threonine protein kinase/predicted ATPase
MLGCPNETGPRRGPNQGRVTLGSVLSRYQIRRELGRGGTGVVYEAFDAKDRSLVALKTIESPLAEHLYRLKHEFRALADVQHPNLVRFGELTCGEDGEWFFTMELIDGTDFVRYVREGGAEEAGAPVTNIVPAAVTADAISRIERVEVRRAAGSEPAPSGGQERHVTSLSRVREQRLRSALSQLVGALSAIHDAGHVHRDVKPSNVLVTREGRVVVLDFGLVSSTSAADAAEDLDLWVVGTPAYMSPEQVEGGTIGPASDWYGVGVMLFLALTGQLPFSGSSAEMIKQKLAQKPPSPLELVPGLPVDLCELALDLLQIDKNARPGKEEIQATLEGRSRPSSAALRGSGSVRPPFVGRSEELRHLGLVFEQVAQERVARAVVIEGGPGIGKSSLVRRFLRGRGPNSLLLSGRCYEQEDVPFKGIDSIVDALSEHLVTIADADVRMLIAGGIRYLTALFPVLLRVPLIEEGSAAIAPIGNPSAVREQAFRELEELVEALTRQATLILFVDDLQWADRDSITLLRGLLLASKRSPLLLLATMRTGTEIAPEIAAFAAEAERLSVGGLSTDESRALLEALWDKEAERGEGTRASKDGLIREAEGHPLFLAELVRSAGDGTSRSGALELGEVLWDRIRARDAVDRRFLEMVSVGGAPLAYDVIAAAAEVDAGEVQTRLGSLRAAQLVRVSRRGGQRTVEAYHDRVRESVLRHLRGAEGGEREVARMHGRLARALLKSIAPAALGENVFALAQHFNAARETIEDRAERLEVGRLDLLASRDALRATAYDRARGYARAGLAFLGEEGWKDAYEVTRDLHVAQMWAEAFADDAEGSQEAERVFQAARARVTSESDRTALHFERISILTMRRQLSRAMDAGRERLAELGISIPTLVTLDMLRAQREAIRTLQGGRSAGELLALPDIRSEVHEGAIRTIVALIPVAFFIDANLRAWLHMSVVLLSLEHGLCDAASYSLSGYGTLLRGIFDEQAEAAAFGRAAFALHERLPDNKFAARLVFHYGGWHAPWIGSFAEAKDMLRRAYELARAYGDTTHEMYASAVLSVVTFCASADLAEVEKTATWAADVALKRKDYDMAWVPEAHARYAAALRGESGEPGSAMDLGRPGSSDDEFRSRLGVETPTGLFYYRFCNAELAYLGGDVARADGLLREAAKGAQVISGLPTVFELCLLECLVAARRHDAASAEEKGPLVAGIEARVARLRGWMEVCPANFEPQYLIAQAELARVQTVDGGGNVPAAYERAWTAARKWRAPKREAIALELAAAYAAARGEGERAEGLRGEAAAAYARWGATAKAKALR